VPARFSNNPYADLAPNKALCSAYAQSMKYIQSDVLCDFTTREPSLMSTDMGKSSLQLSITWGKPFIDGWTFNLDIFVTRKMYL
jgi:hypothetical protein